MSPCVILGKERVAKQDGASDGRTDGLVPAFLDGRRAARADASIEYAKRKSSGPIRVLPSPAPRRWLSNYIAARGYKTNRAE